MPSEWRTVTLRDVCSKIGSGATPRGGASVYRDSGIAFIRSQNVGQGQFLDTGLAFISSEHAAELDNVAVCPGDLLLNITGASVARVCQVPAGVLPARVNQHVAIIRPDSTTLTPRYLLYALLNPAMQAMLLSWADSGGTRQALTKGMLESLMLPLPPLPEQRAIAHILGTLDDKIELNRRMSETLEAMARALFKAWFVDFEPVRAKLAGREPASAPGPLAELFPARLVPSPLGEIPEGWRVGTLGEIAALNPESWNTKSAPAMIEYLDLSNVKWGRIDCCVQYTWDDAPSRAKRVLRLNDTIVGTVRPGNGSYAYISREGLTGSTGFAVLRPKQRDWAEYIYLAATAPDSIAALSHLAQGAAYPAVRPEVVANVEIVLAPDGLAQKFAHSVRSLMERFSASDSESRTLAALRDALLPKLVSGELRVAEAERWMEEG